jgi:AhpD family alkylhydroperoxidase
MHSKGVIAGLVASWVKALTGRACSRRSPSEFWPPSPSQKQDVGADPGGHGADAFGYRGDLRIDRGLAQLLRLRVSQLNNCTYCLNLQYEAAREAGIPLAKIDTLTAWC